MTRLAFPLFLLCLSVPHSLQAAPSAAELKALGCKVVEKAGAITEVSADTASFKAEDFKLLGQCSSLRKLTLNGKTLTDETLPLLAGLSALEELSTNASQLSDAGYQHFTAFKSLRQLALWHPSFGLAGFTGSGLAQLKALPKLERLTFAGATAGDTALQAIGEITQLREFHTWHTAQTQAGNVALTKLVNLRVLRMGQRLPKWGTDSAASFDGSTIPVLAALPALEKLELFEAVLTAADLMPLKACATLKELKLHTLEISAADVETLRQALPAVKIDHKPISPEEREGTLVKKLRLLPAAVK